MTDITLVRQHDVEIPEKDREAARRVLFGIVDGLGERGKKQWRRFVNQPRSAISRSRRCWPEFNE